MSLVPVKYPLDLTGSATANKVQDEPHRLPTANIRVFVPRYGAFYTGTEVITETLTGRKLKSGVDYYPGLFYQQPSEQTGLEVHQIIVIVDKTCLPDIQFTAQMLGGEYSYSYDAIVQLVQELDLDNRPVEFAAIIGKPDGYPPAPHLHDIGDIYGFEYLAAGLDRIRQAILLGSAASTKAIYDYLDSQVAEINTTLNTIQNQNNTPQAIEAALGYPPVNKEGDNFEGMMTFEKGMKYQGPMISVKKKLTVTTFQTSIDLSLSDTWDVTLSSSTSFTFDVSKIAGLNSDSVLNVLLILTNDANGSYATAFGANVGWADKAIPKRTATPGGRDEFYFTSFDGGVTWTGSLSNENVGQAV